jgi:hypothetical protein
VDHLSVNDIVQYVQVRNVERAYSFDRDRKGVVGCTRGARFAHLGAGRAQSPQYLGAIEALTLAVVAEAHDIERTPQGDVPQIG